MERLETQLSRFRDAKFFEGEDWAFWKELLKTLEHDAAFEIGDYKGRAIIMEIGVCSHWLRPHQTRWTAGGGFALPVGYIGGRWGRTGLPEFDWNFIFQWRPTEQSWLLHGADWPIPKRHFLFRVALPTRTLRHKQAVVHALWMQGTPKRPRKKQLSFYGFRKLEDGWTLRAHWCSHLPTE